MDCLKEFGPLIGYCAHLGKLCLDGHLRQYEVTPVQARVIRFLTTQENAGEVTQRDLERALGLKAPTVNGVVERMEEKGLISRTTSKSDARCRVLLLTEKGRDTGVRFREAAQRVEEIYLSTLAEEERTALRDMLCRLIENLETEVNNI